MKEPLELCQSLTRRKSNICKSDITVRSPGTVPAVYRKLLIIKETPIGCMQLLIFLRADLASLSAALMVNIIWILSVADYAACLKYLFQKLSRIAIKISAHLSAMKIGQVTNQC